jgi:serine protease Do
MQIRGGNLPAAALGSAARVPIGAWVIAIGNPFGLGNSVTVGVLSAKEREIRDPASGAMLQDLLQTDASINRGNSGGALVDLTGDVIGIPTAMIPQAQGLGFAVSIDSVKQVFEKIIETGKAPAWLGISYSFLTPGQARRLDVSGGRGALVQNVEADGPAGRGGIRRGDVILAIDGKAVDSEQALSKMIRAHNTGDRVTLTIWRLGQRVELRITL